MAKKGGSKKMKRLAAPRYVPVARKSSVWLAKPMPGPHPVNESVALITLIKEVLRIADTTREAKKIITSGTILVDGRVVKRPKFPVGLMDVISIPSLNKHYRVVVDNKQRLKVVEIDEEKSKYKLCKVKGKYNVRGGKTVVGLHDGRNVVINNGNIRVGDTVKVEVPTQRIIDVLKLEPEAKCLIVKGKHAGETAVLKKIHPRTSRRETEATLVRDGEEFITVKKYLFVVGNEM